MKQVIMTRVCAVLRPIAWGLGLIYFGWVAVGAVAGQERPRGLGRTAEPTSRPTVRRPPKPATVKTPTGVIVPLGKPPQFYLDKGRELLGKEDFISAKFFFDEGRKRAGAVTTPPSLVEGLRLAQEQALLFLAAAEAERLGRPAEAVSQYIQILKQDPVQPLALRRVIPQLNLQAEEAKKQGDWQTAILYLEQALTLAPVESVQSDLIAALLAYGEKNSTTDPTIARTAFTRVLALHPDNPQALAGQRRLKAADLILKAEELATAQRFPEAEAAFSQALALAPENAVAQRGKLRAGAENQRTQGNMAYENREFQRAQALYVNAATILTDDVQLKDRLEELALRLAPSPKPNGTLRLLLRAGSPFRIRIRGDEVVTQFTTGEKSVTPTVDVSSPFPLQPFAVKITKVSTNARAQISAQPNLANNFTTDIMVEPKTKAGEDIRVEVAWAIQTKGRARWQGQVKPGKFNLFWQGGFFDVRALTGPVPEAVTVTQDALPRQKTEVKIKSANGKVRARVINQGSAVDFYTTIIEVETIEATQAVLDLDWVVR
ncbi:MAG: tetratricopeptide repeat protein [Blastocatellia bacterium]|nr:tetratricopeptide repeat protein [Blastocatellia bacterium]